MTYRIVVQARLSSTRLPGKVLLPLAGFPAVVLCALRAANRGASVVVATSTDPSDDVLVKTGSAYGLEVIRGPLSDVLERFVIAAADLRDNDIVVRLTADNVFPDGDFVARIVEELEVSSVDYVGTSSPRDGLPYGLSTEAFSVRILRKAAVLASALDEREHVTPWIQRHAVTKYVNNVSFGLSSRYDHLRCTLDSLEDYIRLATIFGSSEKDAVKAPWRELLDLLSGDPGSQRFRIPYRVDNKGDIQGVLSLGTAQLGQQYGAANTTGMPSLASAIQIVQEAIDHGVTMVDTARGYGLAEGRVGDALRAADRGRITLVTKLDPLSDLADSASPSETVRAVDASVFRSCHELRSHSIDVLMLHRWSHRRGHSGAIWQRLLELREEGVVSQLGASVATPGEAVEALLDSEIQHIQLPYNLLDWRWESDVFKEGVSRRDDVNFYVRSVYLQGILISGASSWPEGILDVTACVDRLERLATELGRANRPDLCLAYVLGASWVTSAVIGVETTQQLQENLELAARTPLSSDEREHVRQTLGHAPEALLNPARWQR